MSVNTRVKYAEEALNVNMEAGLRTHDDTFWDRVKNMPIGLCVHFRKGSFYQCVSMYQIINTYDALDRFHNTLNTFVVS